MSAIGHSMRFENPELPGEFFPAHVSVALISAILPSQDTSKNHGARAAVRYSRRFGLAYTRTDRWELPPAKEQETLSDLIGHYAELGEDRMDDELSGASEPLPGTKLAGTEQVLRAARELRRNGIEVLQDIPALGPAKIERALRVCVGLGESTLRKFLMYTGDDAFVRGDVHIRTFVEEATERRPVSEAEAEGLVRWAAYELVLSPRYLDFEIWRLHRTRARTRRVRTFAC